MEYLEHKWASNQCDRELRLPYEIERLCRHFDEIEKRIQHEGNETSLGSDLRGDQAAVLPKHNDVKQEFAASPNQVVGFKWYFSILSNSFQQATALLGTFFRKEDARYNFFSVQILNKIHIKSTSQKKRKSQVRKGSLGIAHYS